MINKDLVIYKILGVLGICLVVGFILLNVASYQSIYSFKKTHNVDEVVYGRFQNEEYSTSYISGVRSGTPEYYESIVKFYRDGKDVVIDESLYVEYNEMSYNIKNWLYSFTIFATLTLFTSGVGVLVTFRIRHFKHGHYIGALLSIIIIFKDLMIILNPAVTTVVLVMSVAYVYFMARTRFYDYDESGLTGIFARN